MASETTKKVFKEVRPILSLDRHEAKRRVINLYKAWYRQIPFIVTRFDIPFSETKCKQKLREEFTKYDTIGDIRVIDMLVIRGQMHLQEIIEVWTTRRGIGNYFADHMDPKPHSFLGKFLNGKD